MDGEELSRRIGAFNHWPYLIELADGVSTPSPGREMVNRHEQRRRYFFQALLDCLGGSLAGQRVVDLGCSAGWWSLLAIEAGADYVLGIDVREPAIEQARLVFEAREVPTHRYDFQLANVLGMQPPEPFDVVLCLGLLDHLAKPVELFELMAATGAGLLVLDTAISRSDLSLLEISRHYDPSAVVDHQILLTPSRAAVADLAREQGFETYPLAPNFTDYTGLGDYRRQRRLAFICTRSPSPAAAVAEESRSPLPWWLAAARPQLGDRLRRRRPRP